jgi:hypothetical protein
MKIKFNQRKAGHMANQPIRQLHWCRMIAHLIYWHVILGRLNRQCDIPGLIGLIRILIPITCNFFSESPFKKKLQS